MRKKTGKKSRKHKPRIVAVVQARTGSQRLPNKMIMKIKGITVIEHLIRRLKHSKMIDEVIIATSTKPNDKKIADIAKKTGTPFFRGSESDVLKRFAGAAQKAKAEVVVRICGDQPLVDAEIVDNTIKKYFKTKADYASTMLVRTFPQGVDAEVFSNKILQNMNKVAKTDYQREHVTPYIYQNPDKFKIYKVMAGKELRHPDIKLTLDTKEDFEFIKKIINSLSKKKKMITTRDVVRFVKKHK